MLCSVMVLLVLMVLQIMQHIILFIKVKDVHFVRRVRPLKMCNCVRIHSKETLSADRSAMKQWNKYNNYKDLIMIINYNVR